MRHAFAFQGIITCAILALTSATASAANNIVATYLPSTRTLTMTGDAADNSVTLTVQNNSLILTGANGTTVNGAAKWSVSSVGTTPFFLNGNLGSGSDLITFLKCTVNIPFMQLGPGNDRFILDNARVGIDTLDGGPGSDNFTLRNGSSLRIKTLTNFP